MDTTDKEYAEKFATVSKGMVVSVTDAFPPHELLENQFALTPKEYYLLRGFLSMDEVHKTIDSIEKKLFEVNNAKSK